MLTAICLAAFLLAPPLSPPPADVPKVELDFNLMRAGDWKGKRFNEIVPADQIRQIGRLAEYGFARGTDASGEQAAYDAFLTHLLESQVVARDWSLGGNEGRLAELLVLTKDGRLLHIEVIGTAGVANSPTAIIVHAKGHGARIDVRDFIQKVLTPEDAIKAAGDSELAKEFNAKQRPVEFKVEYVAKSILVKAAAKEGGSEWEKGHGPGDVALRAKNPADRKQARFLAVLTANAISQLNKEGIKDIERHFKGKTIRATGAISWCAYDGYGTPPEVEVLVNDLSHLEVID